MLKLLSSIIIIFLTVYCNAQGSWDIGYLHVDSINEHHIGHVVRIDFKSNDPWNKSNGPRGIRSYVGMKDTGVVSIDTSEYILVERRKIYVDHGSYGDQYLECISCNQEPVFIFDAKILDVDPAYIRFQIDMEIRRGDNQIKQEIRIVRIERKKLDGVMFRL